MSELLEIHPIELTEEDKRFLEWQVYVSHKVFGITQQELMGEGTEHSDSAVPSVPVSDSTT